MTSDSASPRPLNVVQLGAPPKGERGLIERLVSAPVRWTYADGSNQDAVARALTHADVFVGAVLTKEMVRYAGRLQLIALAAAGFEKIDAAAVPQGCAVVNAYEHEAPIAEYVMMAAVALDHEVLKADRTLRQNDWSMWLFRHPPYRELLGQTMGVIGLGHIGRRVLHLARAYDMRLIAVSRRAPDEGTRRVLGLDWAGDLSGLPRLLAESDFVVVATPLNDKTAGLIGHRELAQMKPTAYLINPSRGPIVDEEALYLALRDGKIGGAAIDVWWRYPEGDEDDIPPSRFPFAELDNVLMTPHISGGTAGTAQRRARVVADNIDRFYRGEPLRNVVASLSRA